MCGNAHLTFKTSLYGCELLFTIQILFDQQLNPFPLAFSECRGATKDLHRHDCNRDVNLFV